MVQRYASQSNMAEAINGTFVSLAEYEKLESLLAEVLNDAAAYLKQVESGEISAADADKVLRVSTRLAQSSG